MTTVSITEHFHILASRCIVQSPKQIHKIGTVTIPNSMVVGPEAQVFRVMQGKQ